MRSLLSVIQAKATLETTLQFISQSFLYSSATAGENASVPRMRETIQVISKINSTVNVLGEKVEQLLTDYYRYNILRKKRRICVSIKRIGLE